MLILTEIFCLCEFMFTIGKSKRFSHFQVHYTISSSKKICIFCFSLQAILLFFNLQVVDVELHYLIRREIEMYVWRAWIILLFCTSLASSAEHLHKMWVYFFKTSKGFKLILFISGVIFVLSAERKNLRSKYR